MSPELANRFLSEVADFLRSRYSAAATRESSSGQHPDVKLLINAIAAQFGVRLAAGVAAGPERQADPDLAFLNRYTYSIDEQHDGESITPEILSTIVESYAVSPTEQGAFYTPPRVVAHICLVTIEALLGVRYHELARLAQTDKGRIDVQLSELKVIDPACGCGAFLVGMIHEMARWKRTIAGESEAQPLTAHNFWGTDVNSIAAQAASIRTELALHNAFGTAPASDLTTTIFGEDGLCRSKIVRGGSFDLVVTNPPFGVTVPTEVRDRFFDRRVDGVQSRDAYGIFMARSLELLKPAGVAALLVSDTWRTIKSHRPLRKRLATQTTVVSLTDLPPWIFPATVNTGIVILKNSPPSPHHRIQAKDLRIIPSGDWGALANALKTDPGYEYSQNQTTKYRSISFFIASPRLHRLMSDQRFTTLGEVAAVRQGLATGDNKRYLRKLPGARGNYVIADQSLILNQSELVDLSLDEKVGGVDPARYGGRFLVPYDKGGSSDTSEGWLPNYYVPTVYFIDWSQSAVAQMKTSTSPRQNGKIASRFQNSEHFFKRGITFSYTGYYAPCYRLSSGGVFDVGGSSCFDLKLPLYPVLAILASKLMKYLAKNYINHTVNFQVDDFKALPLPREIEPAVASKLESLVNQIVTKQRTESKYPYHLHEQAEIDRLVYEQFGLTVGDMTLVDEWYFRRYFKLLPTIV